MKRNSSSRFPLVTVCCTVCTVCTEIQDARTALYVACEKKRNLKMVEMLAKVPGIDVNVTTARQDVKHYICTHSLLFTHYSICVRDSIGWIHCNTQSC